MNDELKKDYEKSIDFWNEALVFSSEELEGEINQDEDYKEIGSKQLFLMMEEAVKGMSNVLDYGCGNGWLDVIMTKNGVRKIKAVDVAPKAVESAKLYAKAFESDTLIDYEAVSVDWLSKKQEGSFDNAVCCNVLDVIPMEVSESIVMNLSKAVKKGGTVLITLNPFFGPEVTGREGMDYKEPYLYMNGVLRVNNHPDEEWTKLFSKYFEVEKLSFFKWDAEATEKRRFYVLKSK